jgi:hypothetical protein
VDGSPSPPEHEKEAQVLKVCLNEIVRARPFLIVIVADRYGWVPPRNRAEAILAERGLEISAAGKSVTALEIEYGALHAECEKGRSFFYFRQLDYSKIPPELRGNYSHEFSTAANASDAARKLKALKARICETVPKKCVPFACFVFVFLGLLALFSVPKLVWSKYSNALRDHGLL